MIQAWNRIWNILYIFFKLLRQIVSVTLSEHILSLFVCRLLHLCGGHLHPKATGWFLHDGCLRPHAAHCSPLLAVFLDQPWRKRRQGPSGYGLFHQFHRICPQTLTDTRDPWIFILPVHQWWLHRKSDQTEGWLRVFSVEVIKCKWPQGQDYSASNTKLCMGFMSALGITGITAPTIFTMTPSITLTPWGTLASKHGVLSTVVLDVMNHHI